MAEALNCSIMSCLIDYLGLYIRLGTDLIPDQGFKNVDISRK